VKKRAEFNRLTKIARVERKRAGELFKPDEVIVLDLCAKRKLSPADLRGKQAVVVGGILGNDPPLGRTRELLTKSLRGAAVRNLGKHQFSIDGAVKVAKLVSDGKPLEKVPVQLGLEVKVSRDYSTFLPYAFPLVNGKPLISRELVKYLKKH
jgi:ribosome biogenesis SPOUT family RNA methylase Rps3